MTKMRHRLPDCETDDRFVDRPLKQDTEAIDRPSRCLHQMGVKAIEIRRKREEDEAGGDVAVV